MANKRQLIGVIVALAATLVVAFPAQADSTGTYSPSWGTAKIHLFEGGKDWLYVDAEANSAGSAKTYVEVRVVVDWGLDWTAKVVSSSGSYVRKQAYWYGFDDGAYALARYCKSVAWANDPCTGWVALNLHDH